MNIDTALWIACSVAEAIVIGLLIYRRIWRAFPIFLIYSFWTLAGSAILYTFHAHRTAYLKAYLAFMLVDSVLLFGVLVELGYSILRPLRASLPRVVPLIVISGTVLALGAAVWPFAVFPGASHLSTVADMLTRIQQDFSVVRVLIFLALAGGSQMLSISWRDRELQIATGLGFTSLVGLVVAMLHTHETTVIQYSHLSRLVTASYFCSLLYWVVSFARKEQERRAFTPQMQSMLLAVAGASRTTRVALQNSAGKAKEMDR